MPINLKIEKFNLNQILNLILLIIACLLAMNIYKGQNRKIVQMQQAHSEQVKKNELLIRISDLKKKIEFYKAALRQRDFGEIIYTITAQAPAAGIKIISLKPVEAGAGGGIESGIYSKIFFNLVIEADNYHCLGRFIGMLENDPMIFIIESLQVRRITTAATEQAGKLYRIQGELSISKLFYKD